MPNICMGDKMKKLMIMAIFLLTILQAGELEQKLNNSAIGTKEVSVSIQVRIIIPARKLANNHNGIDSTKIKKEINNKPLTQIDD